MDVEQALEAGWRYLLHEEMDLPFAEVVRFVRSLSPEVTPARVRADFDRRLRARHGLAPAPPEEALELIFASPMAA